MVMGRREFLSCATGALTVALPNRRWPSRGAAAVVVLDLAEHCSLPESMAGYALASAGLASHPPVLLVPAPGNPGEALPRADGHPVALTRRVERGTLIYLGSPLGPALWAGDAEARQWLSRLFLL